MLDLVLGSSASIGVEIWVIIWFIIIIVAAIIELNTMDLSSIWFSAGAFVAFIISFVDSIGPAIQIAAFLIVSIVLLVLVRPVAKNYFKTNQIGTNSDRLIGKVAICTKPIEVGERGEVKIDGKYWLAVSSGKESIALDEKVEVLAIEGVKLIVDKIQ